MRGPSKKGFTVTVESISDSIMVLHRSALRESTSPAICDRKIRNRFERESRPPIFENCIEKNFHVSKHEADHNGFISVIVVVAISN